nr:MAG TPA: tail fiber assembly protein [Caudoviricetes sp.]
MKFIVERTEIKKLENGMEYIAIYDKDNKDWYEELKKFQKDTLKVMYNKETLQVSSKSKDASFLAPTAVGDVIEEIESEDVAINPSQYFVEGKLVELKPYETIKDGKVAFNKDFRIEEIKKELQDLKIKYSEKEFIFKEKYKQKNRELDKNNLGNITSMLLAAKQGHFNNWKFKDLDDNDVYVDLTIQDMLLIAKMMQEQTSKAMMTETALKMKIETLDDGKLKDFDSEKEFEKEWNK